MVRLFWTPEEDKILRDMAQAKERAEDIAKEVGRTTHAVYRRVARLKVKLHVGGRLDPDKRSQILALCDVPGGMSCLAMSRVLRKTDRGILKILHEYQRRGIVKLAKRGPVARWVTTKKWSKRD